MCAQYNSKGMKLKADLGELNQNECYYHNDHYPYLFNMR
jgi:hypothetical protein